MNLAPSFLLLPIFYLPLIPDIKYSIFIVTLVSIIYELVSIKNYKIYIFFQLLQNLLCINLCTMIRYQNFHYSLYFMFLFLLEYRFFQTKLVLYYLYGYNILSNLNIDSRIEFWLFISTCTYLNIFLRTNKVFLWHEKWVLSFSQGMYIYHSLKCKSKLLV